jgi:hypothetical protein
VGRNSNHPGGADALGAAVAAEASVAVPPCNPQEKEYRIPRASVSSRASWQKGLDII